MLRLLHTADVHLGARHADLGEAAAAQRERQFAAFRAAVDLAIAEKVDLFLVAGDLFDSNVQPKRSVERVAAELARLAQARIRSVLVPGTHDVYDRVVGVSRLRHRGAWPASAPPRRWSPSSRRITRGSTCGDRRGRPRSLLPDQARAAQPAARPRRRRDARRHLAHRRPPHVRRDPRPHRPRRGRGHGRGDRRQRPRLPRARALALRAGRQDQGRHLRLRRGARAGRRRPGQGRQGAAGDARRRRTASTRSRSTSASSARRRSSGARSMRGPSGRSRPSSPTS